MLASRYLLTHVSWFFTGNTLLHVLNVTYTTDSYSSYKFYATTITHNTEQEDQQQQQQAGSKRAFTGTAVVPNDVLTAAQGASSGAGVAKYEVKWVSQAAAEQRQVLHCVRCRV